MSASKPTDHTTMAARNAITAASEMLHDRKSSTSRITPMKNGTPPSGTKTLSGLNSTIALTTSSMNEPNAAGRSLERPTRLVYATGT